MVVWRTSPGLVVVKSADKCQRCVGVRLHFVCLRVAMVSSLDRPSNTLSGTEGAGSVATGAAGCSVLSQCLSLSTVLALMPFAHGRKVRHILCPPGQACQGPSTVRVVNWSAGQGSACVIVFRRGGNSARGAQCTSRKAQYATPFSSWGKATHGTFEAKRVVHLWRTDWMRRAGLQLEIMPGGCRPTCDSWQSSNTTLEA